MLTMPFDRSQRQIGDRPLGQTGAELVGQQFVKTNADRPILVG